MAGRTYGPPRRKAALIREEIPRAAGGELRCGLRWSQKATRPKRRNMRGYGEGRRARISSKQNQMTGCDMDWLTFVSKVIEATAWPLAVLILVFKFSDRFRELLGNLTEFNLPGGISGKFEAPLQNAEHLARQLELTFIGEGGVEFTPDPIALNANPTGVIMEAWKELTSVGGDLFKMAQILGRDARIVSGSISKDVLRELESRCLVPDDEIKLLRELREIRNRAAHSVKGRPTPDEAERFVSIVRALEAAWIARLASAEPR